MFWCLRPTGGCEWNSLHAFVKVYNDTCGTKYKLSQCLDAFDATQPQPEVLVESDDQSPMVIERKLIVWPPDYYKFHKLEHTFSDCIFEILGPYFQDRTYILEVNASSLRDSKKRVKKSAESIAKKIISYRKKKIIDNTIFGKNGDIPWRFRPLTEFEMEDDTPPQGVGVSIHDKWDDLDPQKAQEKIAEAILGITKNIEEIFQKVERKCKKYPHCSRVILIECCIDSSIYILEEDIQKIIREANLPEYINEIWWAYPEWVSADDFKIGYQKLR